MLRNLFRRKPARPFQLFQIEPTLQCGLDCVMCPWTAMRADAGSMTWETFTRIAANFSLTEGVDLTGGGEPLLNARLLEMAQACKQAGCTVGFSTNAMHLTPETSKALIDLDLDWISFSVDAATAELYNRIRRGASFERVTGHIAGLRDQKAARGCTWPRMMMVFVMMSGEQQNYHQLPEYVELAHRLGVEQVIAKNLDVILKDGDDARRLFSHAGPPAADILQAVTQAQERARRLGVGLRLYALQPQEQVICEHNPLGSVFFTWKGEIAPCITLAYAGERVFAGERVHAPCQVFGDINRHKLADVWDSPEYTEFRQRYERRKAAQRQVMMDALLGGEAGEGRGLPPAPEGCRTCYYLYGI